MILVPSLLSAVAAIAAGAAWADWRRRRIPQWPAAVIAAGWAVTVLAAAPLLGGPPVAGLACGALVLAVGAVPWRASWLGGGDVKLAAALGLWLGPLDFGLALLGAGTLTLVLAGSAFALGGDLARRGLPLACALAPPAAGLLVWRAVELAAPAGAGAWSVPFG